MKTQEFFIERLTVLRLDRIHAIKTNVIYNVTVEILENQRIPESILTSSPTFQTFYAQVNCHTIAIQIIGSYQSKPGGWFNKPITRCHMNQPCFVSFLFINT